jgi:hypothetical protein
LDEIPKTVKTTDDFEDKEEDIGIDFAEDDDEEDKKIDINFDDI